MLTCQEMTELCSAELDRPLRPGERLSLHAHLFMCRGCSRYRRQLFQLRSAAQAYGEGLARSEPTEEDPTR